MTRDGLLVASVDLNMCRQIKDKWCFRVSISVISHNIIDGKLPYYVKMTQRLDLYAESLAKATKPDYKPDIVQ